MATLYTDGAAAANQAEVDIYQGELSQAEVDAWITNNAPGIAALISAGDLTITADEGDVVKLTFNEAATGDRSELLHQLALDTRRLNSVRPDDQVAEWTLPKTEAKSWAQNAQSALALW